MKKEIAQIILNETEAGYDTISGKFSETRKHFWRSLEFIRDYTHEGDNVLDYGCGNGRLLELFDQKNINYWGVDVSGKLIELAKERYINVLDSSFHRNDKEVHFQKINPIRSTIPFESGFFNSIYSIAVFHHFPSKKYRDDIAKELYRITKDGGHVVITVWYLWQKKYFKNILKNWIDKILGKSKLDWNDCEISFTDNHGVRVQRFHHAFTKRELQKLFKDAGFEIEKCDIIDGRNIIFIGKK